MPTVSAHSFLGNTGERNGLGKFGLSSIAYTDITPFFILTVSAKREVQGAPWRSRGPDSGSQRAHGY